MKRLILFCTICLVFLIACNPGQKPIQHIKDDFSSERLQWDTYLGDNDWQLTQGNWVVSKDAPFELLTIARNDWSARNARYLVTLVLGEKGEAGMVLGFRDEKNFWKLTLDHSNNRIALWQRKNGQDRLEVEGRVSLSHREFHKIELETSDVLIKVTCDGLTIFESGRPDDMEGKLGLYVGYASGTNTKVYACFTSIEAASI